MKRSPDGLGPVVTLDRRKALPIHRQIYDGYREAILDGRLRPGQRLPSTRTLADDLGISRIPAVTAFAQLLAEGYLESRVGAGTFVSAALPDLPPRRALRQPARAPRPGSRVVPPTPLPSATQPWLSLSRPFRLHQPALDEFPADLWARLRARPARALFPPPMGGGVVG